MMSKETPAWLLYPTDTIISETGILPSVSVPENFRLLVPRFYQQGRRDSIEQYTREVSELADKTLQLNLSEQSKTEVRLYWDLELGLRNIGMPPSGGLDLDVREKRFIDHNLGTFTGFIAGCIARRYVFELLQSESD